MKLAREIPKKLWIFTMSSVYHIDNPQATKGLKQIMRSSFFLLIIISLTAALLNAAGQKETEEITLTVWDFKYKDSRTNSTMNKVDNLFRSRFPEVRLEHTGFDDEEYIPALRTALLAGTGPDVIWLHQGLEFIEYHPYLESLDEYLLSHPIAFLPDSLVPCRTEDDTLHALPLTFQGIGWYYNKQLLKDAGLDPSNPPVQWRDFLKACRMLVDKDIIPIAIGNNRPLGTDFIRRNLITSFFSEAEIASFYKQGWGLRTPRFRQIMEMILTLREQAYLDESGIFRAYFNYAPESFSAGRTAFIPGLLSDIANWHSYSDKLGKDNVGYFPSILHPDMVRPGTQLLQQAGVILAVNKQSSFKDLAFQYIANFFSDQAVRILIEDLGMLIPLQNISLPVNEYPVLSEIERSLQNNGSDIELFTSSLFIRDTMYRYDELLLNTREISLNEYIIKLQNEFDLY